MTKPLHLSIDDLKKSLLTMGGMVEEAIDAAVTAIMDKDEAAAQSVIKSDDAIDRMENRITSDCLKLLALFQPVAEDLRIITSVMEINIDLERMADLAVNSAERSKYLIHHGNIEFPPKLYEMTGVVRKMTHEALRSFVESDAQRARRVCEMDDEVDDDHRLIIADLISRMKSDPESIEVAVQLLWVSRNLERIADHATNIAEDVVYMVEGESIRHKHNNEGDGKNRASTLKLHSH